LSAWPFLLVGRSTMDDTYTDRRPHQNISPKQAYDVRARAWAFVFQCWHQKQMITRSAPESDSCDDYEKPANEERSQSDVNENAIVVAEGDRTEKTRKDNHGYVHR